MAASRIDGRTLRSQRTRQAIVDANMDLMLEGNLRPTAVEIARRAGISTRALFTHFPDLENLFAATGEQTLAIQYAEYEPVPADLPLDERVERFCQQRAQMLESIAGASRAAQARLPFSPQLRQNRARHNARLRTDLGLTFAPEIAEASEDADLLVTALLVACTWPTWMGSRDDLALTVREATAIMIRTTHALLLTSSRAKDPRPSN
ncbi:TetR/AcrR family transcriptional regulator [Brevibacterium yomogidense]|uniref:TetR/AcrR family transcriptional regulator n=1 Tax=Brevibacterium yomogidense TaxID=946573 RepID=UPI0018E00DE5|nr:TetR/AcrR family transcriptional regulator [Brevibacterium yomogidense]